MKTITLEHDIKVFYIEASSFPGGIIDAHTRLSALVAVSADRIFFGISRPEDGQIVYRAAAQELNPVEAKELNCETLILRSGNYITLTIENFQDDLTRIDKAFQKLLNYPGLDPHGYCVEWYLPAGQSGVNAKDVQCMIRLEEGE